MIIFLLLIAFIYFLVRLIRDTGRGFPIFELTAVLYLLQYGVAPWLEYKYILNNTMAIGQDEYLEYATLASLAFIIGLFSVKQNLNFKKININPYLASQLGRGLIIIGVLSSIFMNFLPESFRAILNFIILFRVVGVYCLVYSNNKIDRYLVIFISGLIAISAIINALLVEFIIFSLFLSMFIATRYTISIKVKISAIAGSLLFLTIYQGIKEEYRTYAWYNSNLTISEKYDFLLDLVVRQSEYEDYSEDLSANQPFIETVHRLNQGWQLSLLLNHVPSVVDFQYGREMAIDILSAVLPRFIWPDKREVNDNERFFLYTGYPLGETTSMSVGVFGDFYLNYGYYGSIVALFIFGSLLARLLRWLIAHYVLKTPINLIWIPFVFSYLVRPGNEFYMLLNHLIKAMIVFFFVRNLIYPLILKRDNLAIRGKD